MNAYRRPFRSGRVCLMTLVAPAWLCMAVIMTPSGSRASGPGQDNRALLLEELRVIKERKAGNDRAERSRIARELSEAIASRQAAIDLYFEAVRATRFAGDDREQTQFREWRKKNEDQIKSPDHVAALHAHMTYLGMAIQCAGMMDRRPALPSLTGYVRSTHQLSPAARNSDLLKRKLSESVLVKYYRIQEAVSRIPDWEEIPGHLDGIERKTIFPMLRRERSPELIRLWDEKILRETEEASRSGLTYDQEQFRSVRWLSLQWDRAKDLVAIGQTDAGLAEMFRLVKANASHPDAGAWIAELERLLAPKPPTAPP